LLIALGSRRLRRPSRTKSMSARSSSAQRRAISRVQLLASLAEARRSGCAIRVADLDEEDAASRSRRLAIRFVVGQHHVDDLDIDRSWPQAIDDLVIV